MRHRFRNHRRRRHHRRHPIWPGVGYLSGRGGKLRLPGHGGHALIRNGSSGHAGLHVTRTFYNVNPIAGPLTSYFTGASFDPSGTLGATTFGSIANAASLPGWGRITAIFDQYKLNWIKFVFTLVPASNTVHDPPSNPLGTSIRLRYQYDLALPNDSVAFSTLPEVVEHRFTPEAPVFSYKVYPRELVPAVNSAGVITGNSVSHHTWTDCEEPVPLYGVYAWIQNLAVDYQITVDVMYNCSFRYIHA